MRLKILDLARNDLIEGYHFYEDREKGVGDYFLSNLYADIEALKLFAGRSTRRFMEISSARCQSVSRLRSIIQYPEWK
jgi:hypothetical protein